MTNFINDLKRIIKNSLAQLNLLDPFRKPFTRIEFETTTYCNRKCEYCPNSKYERKGAENGRYMKQEVFEKLLSDLADINYKGLLAPHFYGEPLTDPRLADWVSGIRKTLPESTIRLVTNGDFLDKKKYKELINAGVDYFEVSKHDPELPQRVVELLECIPVKERSKRIKILDFYEDYGDKQENLNTRGGEITLKKKGQHPVCCISVTYPVLNTFGDVILCCNDYHSRYISGNIMERHLIEIWQDPKNIGLRQRIYKGHFDLPICQNCWI